LSLCCCGADWESCGANWESCGADGCAAERRDGDVITCAAGLVALRQFSVPRDQAAVAE
jgi:hypothetical protein